MSAAPDPSALIIPFGKHKGTTVAELLVKDPDYVRWVMGQDWMAQRFAELHAAIATRGAISEDTPEHNALQARFLDPDFRLACLRLAVPPTRIVIVLTNTTKRMEEERYVAVKDAQHKMTEALSHLTYAKRELEGGPWYHLYESARREFERTHPEEVERHRNTWHEKVGRAEAELAKCRTSLSQTEAAVPPPQPVIIASSAKFEQQGVDVVVSWSGCIGDDDGYYQGEDLPVELKPSMGDDYPAVMRQMARLRAWTLVVGVYNGTTVSTDQLRQMFEANGRKLIFVHEIEVEMAKAGAT